VHGTKGLAGAAIQNCEGQERRTADHIKIATCFALLTGEALTENSAIAHEHFIKPAADPYGRENIIKVDKFGKSQAFMWDSAYWSLAGVLRRKRCGTEKRENDCQETHKECIAHKVRSTKACL
jgi:hypothetical protein